eukprot:TRINITY_DN3907_c0_g1_i21.p4 TRINITY_DN3907_c0_g1~~TRINITY_DN3907_c0_g1_i21.p4  ORF type:complete len:112 (+),score=30.89 TRINITY_DN3907_c0_g1_i21:935-1270(+)
MKNAEAPKNDLFGNLKLKVPNPVKDSREKAESSFAFMRKKSEKKEELEELDLDFTLGNAPAAKTSDLLDTAFNPIWVWHVTRACVCAAFKTRCDFAVPAQQSDAAFFQSTT